LGPGAVSLGSPPRDPANRRPPSAVGALVPPACSCPPWSRCCAAPRGPSPPLPPPRPPGEGPPRTPTPPCPPTPPHDPDPPPMPRCRSLHCVVGSDRRRCAWMTVGRRPAASSSPTDPPRLLRRASQAPTPRAPCRPSRPRAAGDRLDGCNSRSSWIGPPTPRAPQPPHPRPHPTITIGNLHKFPLFPEGRRFVCPIPAHVGVASCQTLSTHQ